MERPQEKSWGFFALGVVLSLSICFTEDMSNATTTKFHPVIQSFRDDFGINWEIRNGAEVIYMATSLGDAKSMFLELKDAKSTADAMDIIYGGQEQVIEDEDGSLAYARMLERRAERGTWFGGGE